MENYTNITVLKEPVEVYWGDWLIEHPDCDTICEDSEIEKKIIVFAFANSSAGNKELKLYRDDTMKEKDILKGLSQDAINGLVLC